MKPVISVENLSKSYTLGQIGTGTFSRDLSVWLARVRRKPNPLLRIGETDHGKRVGEEIWALKDVSFKVQQGEVLGIIGRNGAGKSTLLKILSRVTAPTSGEVKVKGRIASLLEVGTGFHPELTGRENIYLNGAILGMSKAEVTRKFDEIVDFSGVEKFIDTPVKRYSSGMYVRLAFAVAAHLESEILLVDEVLAVGDAEFQKKCLGKMGDVAQNEGRTVLFVSHNMGAIKYLSSAAILVNQGRIYESDNTEKTIQKYLGSYLIDDKLADVVIKGNNKRAYIKRVSLLNKSGEISNSILMGDEFTIKVEIYSSKKINLPTFLLQIEKNPGEILFAAYSYESAKNIKPMYGEGKISCTFEKLQLNPGKYYLNVVFGEFSERIDKQLRVISINVKEKDIYDTGVIPDPLKSGVLWINHTWDFTWKSNIN